MAPLSQFYIRILLNGPQDARPEKNRFAYAESPAKQRHDRDLPYTAHNPNELGRIRILLPVVWRRCLADTMPYCYLFMVSVRAWRAGGKGAGGYVSQQLETGQGTAETAARVNPPPEAAAHG